jgi:hypothetical protein
MLPHIPLYQIEPIKPSVLLQEGATFGQAPTWDGTKYAPMNPVSWFNAGTSLGRISEINVTGNGVFSSVVGNRATLNVSASLAVNGSTATAMNFGAGFLVNVNSGVASISTTAGTGLIGSPGNGLNVSSNSVSLNMASLFSAGAMPNLNGNSSTFLNGAGFFSPPPSSGGITGISVNGAGLYTDIQIGSGLQAIGNVISATAVGGGSTTLTHAGFGYQIFTGSAPAYTTKGLRSLSAGLTISDTGQTLDFQLSGAGSSVGVYNNGAFLGNFPGINFQGFPSVTSSGGLAVVTAPSGGSGGITSLANGTNTTAVNLGGGVWRVDATGGGGNSMIGIRKNSLTVGNTGLINFYGAGLGFVGFNGGGGVDVEILGGGGGGISGVSLNFAGNYTNINFAGNVSVAGNTVTVLGGGGGGSGVLGGTSGNGLTVNPNSVQLALASFFSPGAMPALANDTTRFLRSDGLWAVPPTGSGSSGVTSVSSGAPSVLQVTPTVGSVTITPTGLTTSYTPTWNNFTRTLGLRNSTYQNGILTSQGTTFITIPSGGGELPAGTQGQTMWFNNGLWEATNYMKHNQFGPSEINRSLTVNVTPSVSIGFIGEAVETGLAGRIFSDNLFLYGLNSLLFHTPAMKFYALSSPAGPPVGRQTILDAATDLTSAINLANDIRKVLARVNLVRTISGIVP